jgi:ubiquinol-cytochrome c reductase iron-sulfur subunit
MAREIDSTHGGPGGGEQVEGRRDFLYIATGAFAGVGGIVAMWPLIDNMNPSADVQSLSTVEISLDDVEVGERVTVKWRGQPVFIDHRTQEEIDAAVADDNAPLRDPQTDASRVENPEWLVMIGICTHLGCVPLGQNEGDPRGDWGGWFCPCHGSHYDTSGRIRKGPAPLNLFVPPYRFTDDTTILIG